MTWDTCHIGKKNGEKKSKESMEIFERTSSSRSSGAKNIPMFTMLEHNDKSEGDGNLEGMGYGTFNKWMNGTRTFKHKIKPSVMRVFQSLLDKQNN